MKTKKKRLQFLAFWLELAAVAFPNVACYPQLLKNQTF
jgi:hypothetical protein